GRRNARGSLQQAAPFYVVGFVSRTNIAPSRLQGCSGDSGCVPSAGAWRGDSAWSGDSAWGGASVGSGTRGGTTGALVGVEVGLGVGSDEPHAVRLIAISVAASSIPARRVRQRPR